MAARYQWSPSPKRVVHYRPTRPTSAAPKRNRLAAEEELPQQRKEPACIPEYIMPSNPRRVDLVAEREFAQLNALMDSEGWDSARKAALKRLTAVTCWLNQSLGSRKSYELFQRIADQLVKPELGSKVE